MRDILDPEILWLGTPGRALAELKRNVALPDAVKVEPDSTDWAIDVLANDFDPEGGALTLVSAYAALGTVSVSGFNSAADSALLGWWDAADADTIVHAENRLVTWADKTGGAALTHDLEYRRQQTGTRSLSRLNVFDFDGTRFLERDDNGL